MPETTSGKTPLDLLAAKYDKVEYQSMYEQMSFGDYLIRCEQNPRLARNAVQTVYDMIMSMGHKKLEINRQTYTHYNFFDKAGDVPIFGWEATLDEMGKFFRGAAGGFGTDRRILLLHGPVGSAKSTVCRLLKRGLESYSRTPEGAWYTFKWTNLPMGKEDGIYVTAENESPMHEQPLLLIPQHLRGPFIEKLNNILIENTPEEERNSLYTLRCDGDLDPRSRKFMNLLMARYNGDWLKVVQEHITVVRKVHSESDRIGIGTFQPKDEKNQDSTELTGDINWRTLTHFGTDSDPRAFNFDGEFCVASRGIVEFIEVLKLDKAFLYDLLGASQEKCIKPKKFSQVGIDLVIIGHTNEPELDKLRNDITMEAMRDRTVLIPCPYLLEWSKELQILEHYYGKNRVKQHIAPHTLEIAALWAVLTRLEDDPDNISLVDKAKLYDGRSVHGKTKDAVKEMRAKFPNEGMQKGVSCRYVQDKISNCLASHHSYVNFFMVLNELKDGLTHSSLITDKNDQARYIHCVELATKELDDILKNEVQKALVGNGDEAIVLLCANYIDNVVAYIEGTKKRNPITGKDQEPDERLMRSIEEKINIPEQGADDFRQMISSRMGAMASRGEKFQWDSNERLKKALEAKLYEDVKDTIKLSALSSTGMEAVIDQETQKKIDSIKHRLVTQYGYNQQSATDVLDYVSSIFTRGVVAED